MGSGAVDWEKYAVVVPGPARQQLIAQEKQRPTELGSFASLVTIERD